MMWVEGGTSDARIPKEASMAIDNVKDFIYEYCRKYHFDHMPPAVRERYNAYAKNKDFIGNMKYWARDLDGKPVPTLSSTKYEQLYNMFQAVFENMAQNQKKFAEKDGTKKFFNEWFGSGKMFTHPKPVPGVEAQIDDFVNNVLDRDRATTNQLKNIFKQYITLPDDFDYDSFVSDIRNKKYLTDSKIRDILFQMLNHAQSYSGAGYQGTWPTTLITAYDITGGGALDPDINKWFTSTYNHAFVFAAPKILDQLMKSESLRKDFAEFDFKQIISGKIKSAIEATDYSNESSKDFVPPVYADEKNVFQRIEDKANKIKQNQIDPWTNLLRGTRRYFSPYSKAIMEGMSGIKIKGKDGKSRPLAPTDGLKGILDNSEAISKKILKTSPNGKEHFDWFVKRLKDYSSGMPKAFEGAFRNAKQMRAIVSQIIYDAVETGKVDQAKTALEIISTMKYGFMHSRTMDALGQEDMTVLSDKGLSWNKYEGVKVVTTAMDKTAKLAFLGIGRGVALVRNGIMRRKTKLNGKSKKGSKLEEAHNDFVKQNTKDKHKTEIRSRNWLRALAAGRGQSGRVIDDADTGPTSLEAAKTALAGLTPGTDDYKHLLKDIQQFEFMTNENKRLETWDKDHKDKYLELMAFWDMLETFTKSHQFTLAADKMRKKFLANFNTGASKAQQIQNEFTAAYANKYQNAA